MPRRPIDISQQKFHRLLAIKIVGKRSNGSHVWECRCDCGNVIQAGVDELRNGRIKSCGCLRRENMRQISLEYHAKRKVATAEKSDGPAPDQQWRILFVTGSRR